MRIKQLQTFYKALRDPLIFLRITGNLGNIAGYFIVLNIDSMWGSIVKIISLAMCIPFCVKIKLWDVIGVFAFFIVIDIHNILKLLNWI